MPFILIEFLSEKSRERLDIGSWTMFLCTCWDSWFRAGCRVELGMWHYNIPQTAHSPSNRNPKVPRFFRKAL